MVAKERLPEPHRTQLELSQRHPDPNTFQLLAVHLHKAKFHQGKALDEFTDGDNLEAILDPDVYEKSKGMVASRGEISTSVSAEDAWHQIASEASWIGAIPVQMHRQTENVRLKGFPFIIGFANGTPRIVLNKILVRKSGNLDRVYANEWARPWVIAEILDATGFNTRNLIVATMKADQQRYGSEGLDYLRDIATRTVEAFVATSDGEPIEPKSLKDWKPDWQDGPVRTQVLKYETEWSLYELLGHGDSIRDVIEIFRGNQPPKDVPPDRGLTLTDIL